MAEVKVEPAVLLAHAEQIDGIRQAISPGALPVGFTPAGADIVSAVAATRISARAAEVANGLWSVWSTLGRVAAVLRASARNYQAQEGASSAALSGAAVGGGPAPVAAPDVVAVPAAVPHVYTAPATGSPEQLATLLRSGAGASSPSRFGHAWSKHAAGLDGAIADLGNIRASLSASWSGPAAAGADHALGSAHNALVTHHGRVAGVGGVAVAHAGDYETVIAPDGGVPHPAEFADWNQQLDNAVAANNAYPGVYTGMVVDSQQQLNNGYTQAGSAYGRYSIDPTTGQMIDTATGEPVDPATGEPLGDSAEDGQDGEEMLSMGPEMLTGLLGGAVGAVGGALSALSQGGQQLATMATQAVGQLAKGIKHEGEPGEGGLEGGELGGMSEGGGGGGETVPAAAAPTVGAVLAAPSPAAPAPPAPAIGAAGGRGGGSGFEGMPPMMPMGGGAGMGRGGPQGSSGAQSKRFVPPERPNTQRVIGQTETERIAAKRERREQRMAAAKAAAQEKTP